MSPPFIIDMFHAISKFMNVKVEFHLEIGMQLCICAAQFRSCVNFIIWRNIYVCWFFAVADLLSGSPRAKQMHAVIQSGHTSSSIIHQHTCSHGHHRTQPSGKRSTHFIASCANWLVHLVYLLSLCFLGRESFYPVAHRPRQSPYPMISVEQALSVVLQQTPLPGKTETLCLKG